MVVVVIVIVVRKEAQAVSFGCQSCSSIGSIGSGSRSNHLCVGIAGSVWDQPPPFNVEGKPRNRISIRIHRILGLLHTSIVCTVVGSIFPCMQPSDDGCQHQRGYHHLHRIPFPFPVTVHGFRQSIHHELEQEEQAVVHSID